jgi:hypothetical protein
MIMTKEQERFLEYAKIYADNAPTPPPMPEPTSPSAGSTRGMTVRRDRYGSNGLSSAGKANIQNAPRKQ